MTFISRGAAMTYFGNLRRRRAMDGPGSHRSLEREAAMVGATHIGFFPLRKALSTSRGGALFCRSSPGRSRASFELPSRTGQGCAFVPPRTRVRCGAGVFIAFQAPRSVTCCT